MPFNSLKIMPCIFDKSAARIYSRVSMILRRSQWDHFDPVAVGVEYGGQLPASSLRLSIDCKILEAHFYRRQLNFNPAEPNPVNMLVSGAGQPSR